jgi:hypothetical protein
MVSRHRRGSSLTFIVSDVAPALAAAVASGDSRWPTLARFAGRGVVRAVELSRQASALLPYESSVLESLQLDAFAEHYPSAAVSFMGERQLHSADCWAHLQCVHFAAGLNDLTAIALAGEVRLTEEERLSIAETMDAHLRLDGFELATSGRGDWLVRCPRHLDVRTVAPEIAFGSPLDQSLPSGHDASALRRLMTEMQMLLHEHPVNELRARRGMPAANAVWLWGIGIARPIVNDKALWPIAFGNDSYLKGIYFLHAQSVQADELAVETLLSMKPDTDAIAVARGTDLDELESRWLPALSQALQSGKTHSVRLHLDRWRIEVRRSDLRRFWRRPLAPATWDA